jgi:hypothetical protein
VTVADAVLSGVVGLVPVLGVTAWGLLVFLLIVVLIIIIVKALV